MFLEAKGFQVCTAASGAEALARVADHVPELLISDCSMPGMGGVELSACMKAGAATAAVPILLMSASLRCEVAPGLAYEGFIRKPFLATKLLEEVEKLLNLPFNHPTPQTV